MFTLKRAFYGFVFCLLLPLTAAATASAAAPGPAPGTCSPDELFMNLTSDDTWRAGMALSFAMKNLESGYPVTVFLNVEGVRIALRESRYRHDTYSFTGLTSLEALMEFIAQGGRVIVCPGCLDRSGFKPEELIPGVYLGGPTPEIIRCSSAQISY